MKKIIVAVDFSKNSIRALEFAINIANVIPADIIMVWVNKPASEDAIFDSAEYEQQKEAKQRFEEITKKYSGILEKGKLSYEMLKGKIYKGIADQAKNIDAYMVIAGSHGVSGFEAFWIGSNANKIVSYSPCPVITLRETFPYNNTIQKIVLPIDSTHTTMQKVPFAMEFAKYFNSEIQILEIHTSSSKEKLSKASNHTEQTAIYLKENGIKNIITSIDTDNIATDIIKNAEENKADLIIIMTEQEQDLSTIWLGPYAKKIVNNSPIPVMSIHPKEVDYLIK